MIAGMRKKGNPFRQMRLCQLTPLSVERERERERASSERETERERERERAHKLVNMRHHSPLVGEKTTPFPCFVRYAQ